MESEGQNHKVAIDLAANNQTEGAFQKVGEDADRMAAKVEQSGGGHRAACGWSEDLHQFSARAS